MKKTNFLIVWVIFQTLFNFTLLSQPTSRTQVSLVTCGSGEELYSSFGHSAIWFYDSSIGLDRIYNYGTFDFNTPNFYSKFVQGRLPYALDVSDMNSFMQTYYYEQRLVKHQLLSLDSTEKTRIYNFLENNLLPENKYYHYDFFYDNCSTRLRDLLEKCTNNNLKWIERKEEPITMRQLLNPGVINMPWTTFGFYLTLGNVTDQQATTRSKMFLPNHLYNAVNDAILGDKPLVIKSEPVFVPDVPISVTASLITPLIVFLVLLIIVLALTFYEFKTKSYFKWLDNSLFLLVGVFGIFLTWLWFGTDHQATKWNMNIIWALPTFIVLPFIQPKTALMKYLIWFSIVMVFVAFVSFNLIQEFHFVARIIMLILLVRLLKGAYLTQNRL